MFQYDLILLEERRPKGLSKKHACARFY